MMKLGKLFQKSIILTEQKLDLTRLIASMWLKKLAKVASSKSCMQCSKVISKIDPQVIMIRYIR